jgi:hypothetical protein
VRGLARAQQPVEQGLLVVRPARDRVGAVAVELAGLHPPDVGIVERRDQLEEEVRARDLVGVEDAQQHVALGADHGAGVVDVAGLGPAAHLAYHVPHTEGLAQRVHLRHRRLLRDVAVVADHDGDLGVRVLFEIGVTRGEDSDEGGPQHLFALVDRRYEHVHGIRERVHPPFLGNVATAVEGLRPGRGIAWPQADVKAHRVDGRVHLRDVERDADDPAGQRMAADRDDRQPP